MYNNDYVNWWTRTPDYSYYTNKYFMIVRNDAYGGNSSSDDYCRCVPAFKIKNT